MQHVYNFFLGMDDIVSQIQSDDTLVEKLPCRLELMGYKQCSIWITNQILLNHKEQGKHGSAMVGMNGTRAFSKMIFSPGLVCGVTSTT